MHSSSLPAIALAACSCVCFQTAAASVTYPGTTPGAPAAHREGDVYTLSNNILSASWKVDGSRLIPLGIVNKERGAKDEKAATGAQAPELFRLSTEKDAYNLPSSRFVMEGVPAISALKGLPPASAWGNGWKGPLFPPFSGTKTAG